jgi:arylsulfatase A-like enzyme
LKGERAGNARDALYYHYYEYPGEHKVRRHYGIRTARYKLIHFYDDIDAWELYDLETDPHEMTNLIDDPASKNLIKKLKKQLVILQDLYLVPDELRCERGPVGAQVVHGIAKVPAPVIGTCSLYHDIF